MTWNWMLDYQFGVVNSLLGSQIGWVTDSAIAPWTVTIVTIWKQFPLATVVLLAGLQAIPRELYEAANVDGASKLQQFIYVTLPGLKPVNSVLIMMLILYTFKRISIIYLLTGGGPARATEILPVTASGGVQVLPPRFGVCRGNPCAVVHPCDHAGLLEAFRERGGLRAA